MALSLASMGFAAETEAPSAVITFDGTKETVSIGFRVAEGSIKVVNGEEETEYTTNKTVSVTLNGNKEVKIYGQGLSRLTINDQGMTSLDVTNAPKLSLLMIEGNALTSLDITANPLLTGIYANNNKIESIDLSKNAAMLVVNMAGNRLSGKIDLSAMSGLSSFDLGNNQISEIALPAGSPLYECNLSNNQLTAIDFSGSTSLTDVRLSDNKLKTLDLTGLTALEEITAAQNEITEVKGLADCPEMTDLYLQNNQIEVLDISGNAKISYLNVENNKISVLDVSKLTNLRLFNAASNKIESIDLTNSPYCSQVTLSDNKLTSLDVSAQKTMIKLYVTNNNLSVLDLTKCAYLYYLEAGNNNIESVDISKCIYLREFSAENNKLTELDITANASIEGIIINGNNMDGDAINDIIASLPDVTGKEPIEGSEWISVFNISNMPGTKDADVKAAEDKGWRVSAEVSKSTAPLTIEQLEKFRPLINNDATTGEFTFSSAVQVNYPDASNPDQIIIENFDGKGTQLKNVYINWEEGIISVAPYTFNMGYDYKTDEDYYIMLVNSEAANASSPMEQEFMQSKVTGTIDENKITLDNWCFVRVDRSFSTMTKMGEPVNTTIHVPNATMTLDTYDWDMDWENLLPNEEPVVIGVYTEATDNNFTVYGWYDQPSKVTFDLTTLEGKYIYSTPADANTYSSTRSSRPYEQAIAPLTGTTWDDVSKITKTSFSSYPVESKTELNFGPWIIMEYADGETEGTDVVMGSSAKIALDYELPLNLSGIESVGISEKPVKEVYYNLQGVQVANPESGIYVKVSTYSNGTTKSTKVIK